MLNDLIYRVFMPNIPFGEEHDFFVGIKAIPKPRAICYNYIIQFDTGVYKIGRCMDLRPRLRLYLRDIRLKKSLYGAKNFVLKYLIIPLNYMKVEYAMIKMCERYRINGEYFRGLDKALECTLIDIIKKGDLKHE